MLCWPALVHHGGCSRSSAKHLPDSGVGIQQIDSCVAFVLQHLLGRKRGREREGGRKRGRKEGREGGREGGREEERKGKRGRGGGREGGREGGGRKEGREGRREEGREGVFGRRAIHTKSYTHTPHTKHTWFDLSHLLVSDQSQTLEAARPGNKAALSKYTHHSYKLNQMCCLGNGLYTTLTNTIKAVA